MKKILITGVAGFIGMNLAKKALKEGYEIVGLDNLNEYYDVTLKLDRLKELGIKESDVIYGKLLSSSTSIKLKFIKLNLEDTKEIKKLFLEEQFQYVCHLAAQAGVRYSISNPDVYISSNIIGFQNIIEESRNHKIKHLIYASSSSVYGLSKKDKFSIEQNTNTPISLYAATKKSNELIAHTYSHLFNLNTTGLRFFTVYGPWGRPDMALFLFAKAIYEGNSLQVFNNGEMKRDFTYIDDIVEGIYKVMTKFNDCEESKYRIFNLGNDKPVNLLKFIEIIETKIGKVAKKEFLPVQEGDVISTCADISESEKYLNYRPLISIKQGISNFIDWYSTYYKINK